MTNSSKPTEPTRPLPPPYEDNEGNLRAITTLSPKNNKTRARIPVPPAKVIPVIVIAGIMGSNLRATTDPEMKQNKELDPGEAAWRPPNSAFEGLDEASKWEKIKPSQRQNILDGETLEVDPTGPIGLPVSTVEFAWDEEIAKKRGWGEIHYDSYGKILNYLQQNLNTTFRSVWDQPMVTSNWNDLNQVDRRLWGRSKIGICQDVSDEEIKKISYFHYPVYGFGYNWTRSNYDSAQSLEKKILEIIRYWKDKGRFCEKVILVTHSMGGLVARACAKLIPEKIIGIVHGVMPALGAPVCYRRLACGTEGKKPGDGYIDGIKANKFSIIAGPTVQDATPVLATSAGPLELLPTQLYPHPWLFITDSNSGNQHKIIPRFLKTKIYDFYRNEDLWYRPILMQHVDPGKSDTSITRKIKLAIDQAEWFHTRFLQDYYHPITFAFYANDTAHMSFGTFSWVTENILGLSESDVLNARLISVGENGSRTVMVGRNRMVFSPAWHDAPGDGTVPFQSADGPKGKVIEVFPTRGYDHQGCFNYHPMQTLTLHIIAKMLQKYE